MLANLQVLFHVLGPQGPTPLYLDPGSGSILLQTLIAAGLGLVFVIRLSWKKIKRFFSGSKAQEEPQETVEDKKEDAG